MTRPDEAPTDQRPEFDRVVAEHYQTVRRVVFRLLGRRDGGEDVVQDVFLAAWAGWAKFRGHASVESWLKRIAVNRCRTHLRWKGVRDRWLGWMRGAAPPESVASRDEPQADRERSRRVRKAIDALPGRYREVIVLHYLEQMPVEQIAVVLGTRRNTVDVWLHRARGQLKEALADMME